MRLVAAIMMMGGLCAMGHGSVGLEARVADHLNSPTLFINGEPETPLIFLGEPNLAPGMPFTSQATMAREAGIRILSFGLHMPWPQPGEEPDFTPIDEQLENALSVVPDALVIPRFTVAAPHWWLDANPGNEMVFSDSDEYDGDIRWSSVASEAWRQESLEHLERFVAYVEENWGDHILGYHPCNLSTAEWFYKRSWEPVHSGFEEPMREGFARWAEQEYETIDAVREAWNQPDVTWDTVRVPTAAEREEAHRGMFRDPATERFVIDFAQYQQIAVVEPMESIAEVIKRVTNDSKLVVYFYGYYFELMNIPKSGAASGHMMLDRLLQSPHVDVITSPMSYLDRGAGGISALMMPVDSIRNAGKLYILEDDTRTHHTQPDTPFAAITATGNLDETHWEHRRSFARIFPRRMGTWYMDLISEGWLDEQGVWDEIDRMRQQYDAALEEPSPFDPEVAVVVDERSAAYLAADRRLSSPLLSFFRSEWYRMGTDFRMHYLTDVLEGRVELPKVTLFLGCWRIDDDERDILHEALDGKRAVWFYGSGFQSQDLAGAERMSKLTGFAFDEAEAGPAEIQFTDGYLLTEGIEGETYASADLMLEPRWAVRSEPNVQALATFANDDAVAVAARNMAGWRSIYVGTTGCPAQFIRNILWEAEVHVYVDSDDVVSSDGEFLSVSASSAGEKAILLPPETTIARLDTDEPVTVRGNHAIETFRHGETRHYRLTPKADPQGDNEYLIMQFTNIADHAQEDAIRQMLDDFHPGELAEGRYIGFAPITPQTLREPIEDLQRRIHEGFDWAEAHNVPVYFQIDDMHFLSDELAADPRVREWTAFPDEGETYGPMPRYWFNWGEWLFTPGIPSFASPYFQHMMVTRLRKGVLEPIAERLRKLEEAGRPDLFAGIAIGWETHIPNYTPGEPIYHIDADNPPVNTRMDPPEPMQPHEMAQAGYASLYWEGWDANRLEAEAAEQGKDRDELFRSICFDVIQQYSALLARESYRAGIPRSRIFTHIVPMDSVAPTRSTVSPAIYTSVNQWSIPGFTMSRSTAPYDVERLQQLIAEEEPGQDRFMCAESYFGGQNDFEAFQIFLDDVFGHGGSHIVIWGYTDPQESWYAGHPQDEAIAVARTWLAGEESSP